MITLAFTYIEPRPNTLEMSCVATGGSPFVLDTEGEFIHIASPADMLLLAAQPGASPYRADSITLVFRSRSAMEAVRTRMIEDVEQLNAVTLSDGIRGATLFNNT